MNSFHYLQLSLMGFDWLIIHREHNSQHPLWVGKKKKKILKINRFFEIHWQKFIFEGLPFIFRHKEMKMESLGVWFYFCTLNYFKYWAAKFHRGEGSPQPLTEQFGIGKINPELHWQLWEFIFSMMKKVCFGWELLKDNFCSFPGYFPSPVTSSTHMDISYFLI